MKQSILVVFTIINSILATYGQEDSIKQKNRWTISVGGNYQFSKIGSTIDSYYSAGYSHDINYNLKNSFSPEINFSVCLDRTQKFMYPVGGFNITDNIIKYSGKGTISTSHYNQNTTIVDVNSDNTLHQISISPYYGMECKFPVSDKADLLFSLISVNRIGYYYILNKNSHIDNTLSREQDFYFEFNVNFNLSFGFILKTKGRIKPGFMIYKPLFNSQGIFGEEFYLKNYYDQIGGGLLLNF